MIVTLAQVLWQSPGLAPAAMALLAVLAVAFWLLFLSGMRWYWRFGSLAAVVLLETAFIRKIEFQGDLVPIIHFRWHALNDLTLETHRAAQRIIVQ